MGPSESILKTHPLLAKEWDYSKNTLDINKVSHGSEKRAWWICSVCKYEWEAFINNRAHITSPTGCPACKNKVVTSSNNLLVNFPELCKEWDYEKNTIRPEDITPRVSKRVWWVCSKCNHRWRTVVGNRTAHGCGCPACAGKSASHYNNITLYPFLLSDWDFSKNAEDPKNVSLHSGKKIWWLCNKCGYSWRAVVSTRSGSLSGSRGCPSCAGMVVNDWNRFSTLFPNLVEEWDFIKNEVLPHDISYGSGKKVWWLCKSCLRSWRTALAKRTGRGDGCPECSGSSISLASQRWLDMLGVSRDLREVSIHINKRLFKVDAYDPTTNIIYEFFGDFWHGNPNADGYVGNNPRTGVSYKQLYENTLEKINIFKEAGYNVVYIWEKEFDEIESKK